jgi:signal recognition particle subunit SRP54
MDELVQIKKTTGPDNILFVCDAMIGQDAVRTAAEFDRLLDFTGFVLTKLDGDARGGAALAIKEVTGKPIKFLGMGEGLDKLEDFRPEGLADRILGFGDVVGLMKDFEKVVDADTAEADAQRMLSGEFDYEQFMRQVYQIRKMGNLRAIFEKLPGMGELLEQIPPEALDDGELKKVEVMIQSMTKQERRKPDLIDRSRMRRIAAGSGRSFEEVEALQQRFLQTRVMMGQLGQSGLFGGMGGGLPGLGRSQRRSGARPGAPGAPQLPFHPGMMGAGAPSAEPTLSPEERVARAKEQRDKRKAKKQARKQGRR